MRGEGRREKTLGTQGAVASGSRGCTVWPREMWEPHLYPLPDQCQVNAMVMMVAQGEAQVQTSLGVCKGGPEPTYKMRPMTGLFC